MTTLAVDLGQSIGWIKGRAVGPLQHGTFEMPKTTRLGQWLRGSDGFWREVLPGVTSIAVEQPFMGRDYYPIRKLLALLGILNYWADWHDITNVTEIPVATGKVNLSGRGNADADVMIAAAMERYALDLNEHEAHALGIFDVFMFGRRDSIAKAKTRSGPGKVVMP